MHYDSNSMRRRDRHRNENNSNRTITYKHSNRAVNNTSVSYWLFSKTKVTHSYIIMAVSVASELLIISYH